jgi:hypothetical protein
MSIVFADPGGGFYSTTTQAAEGLWTSLSATIKTTGLPSGNIEPTALAIANAGGVITLPSSPGTYTLGFRIVSTNAYTSSQSLMTYRDPSGNAQVNFSTNSGGTITAARGGFGGTSLGTSSGGALSQNVWAYVELQCFCDSSVGTIGIRINGTSVLSLTGQNTKGSGSSSNIGSIVLGSNQTADYQDIYVTNSSGSYNTGFLGDVQMPISLANANGSFAAWTTNGATPLYNCVNAATPADSTIFASDSTPGDRMAVAYPSTSVTGNIVGVGHISRMQKSTSGTRTVSQVITNNGVDQIQPAVSLGTSYAYFPSYSEVDPNTGLGWTAAGFNTIQSGLITES